MKFGSREICDVTFKAISENQRVGKKFFKRGQPVLYIDTARTSSLEQATTTVYAQGGKGYSRLISWEGEKTMTFNVEDALISPQGLAVLSGAGLMEADQDNLVHFHVAMDTFTDAEGKASISLHELQDELGVADSIIYICDDPNIKCYATVLDGSGAGIEWVDEVALDKTNASTSMTKSPVVEVRSDAPAQFTIGGSSLVKNKTVKLDFYVVLKSGATEINIAPEDFGGYFYVEASTLYRREDTGKDMAAEIVFPKVKIQSGFTFTMSASGDPSVFNFVMDAFPGYTYFDPSKKTICLIQIIGSDNSEGQAALSHTVADGKTHTVA